MILDELLPLVSRPSRYCGNEFNLPRKNWEGAALRLALIFPDLYEIGMSHQGLQILYHLINGREELLAERAYAPAPDLEALLREKGERLFSLESRHSLAEFDVLGITLPFELCYTNILTILDLAGLPLRSCDRDGRHPLVLGGGPCAFHPEPVAEFFDAILLGDGEEAMLEIADLLLALKRQGAGRSQVLARLAEVEGVYVPALFQPRHGVAGEFLGMVDADGQPARPVRRRVLADLETTPYQVPLVPLTRIVHDRLGLEIARGCTRGCRFCQAGIIYRPVRERSPARIMDLAEMGIGDSGFDELALLSLSTGDYSCITELMVALMNRFVGERISVSMPSMRVGTLTPEIMAQIRRVRKTGFTLAPEAGTDRLRRVINKGITEADLLSASQSAFELGWKLLKFYFMFGLPTETDEDLAAIPALVGRAFASVTGMPGRKINVSVATFVPKPHTPFQRARQLGIDEGFARVDYLKRTLRGKHFQLKWHDPRQSFLEGVMSRGDRKLSQVIEKAWQRGARLDAWSDYFRLETWRAAAADCGIDLDSYLRERGRQEVLPWEHLDCGVDAEFIEAEADRGLEEIYTPDCRYHGCQQCGLCDFKTVRPRVCRREELVVSGGAAAPEKLPRVEGQTPRYYYRFTYSRTGPTRFLGHLEVLQVFFRVLRRAGLPVCYSQGFNPTPKVTFSPALPLGTESLAEYLIVEVTEPLTDLEGIRAEFNRQLPAGFVVQGIALDNGRVEMRVLSCYLVEVPVPVVPEALAAFLAAASCEVKVLRKGRERVVAARELVRELRLDASGKLELQLLSAPSQAVLKPAELVRAVLGLSEAQSVGLRITKIWWREEIDGV
ncbi:MAG: TIGR03960 family B12-binding radical SAM protein [Desulfobulbaceae bacterium]|nr:TIGR03960 family B12-binding radical SAM protein [Desulfobulbaceae bacterium]